MTQVQELIEALKYKMEGDTESVFDTVYEKVKRKVFISLLDNSTNVLQFADKEEAMKSLSDYSQLKIKDTKEALCLDTVRKIIADCSKIKILHIDLGFNHYDMYVIIAHDKPIINPVTNNVCEGIYISSVDKMRQDEADITTSFIILSDDNKNFRDENRVHVICHEICHLVLSYMKRNGYVTKAFTDNWSSEMEEFLCDFLPFYHLKERDYLCNFLEYGEKWFKPEIMNRYRQYIKEIVIYMNSEGIQ